MVVKSLSKSSNGLTEPTPTTESERSKVPISLMGLRMVGLTKLPAVIWTRTTAIAEMNRDGPDFIELSRSEVQTLENTGDEESFLTSQLPPVINFRKC